MAGADVYIGTGTTVTFLTSAFSAQVTSISMSGLSRESVDVTHMGSTGTLGGKAFIPGKLADPGELTLEIHFNPDDTPPIMQAVETIRITFPLITGDTTPAKWECSGFATGFEFTDPLEAKMTGSLTIKCTGNITITPAA